MIVYYITMIEGLKMQVPTYDLTIQNGDSEHFYRQLDRLTTKVEKHLLLMFEPMLSQVDTACNITESAVDLLAIGVYWHCYQSLLRNAGFPLQFGRTVSTLRRNYPHLKPMLNPLKGVILRAGLPLNSKNHTIINLTPPRFRKLIKFLESAGDFQYDCLRFRRWEHLIKEQPELLNICSAAATWFIEVSSRELKPYMGDTPEFLKRTALSYRGREDYFSTRKGLEQYYLNMVGAELLNRVYAEEFQTTAEKLVLVPACMCTQGPGNCLRSATPLGEQCGKCTRSCPVCQLTKLGEIHNFRVAIMAHESSLFKGPHLSVITDRNVGVIGIACVPNLLSGGWRARLLNIPVQCVFLDYSGCLHWTKSPLITDCNQKRLLKVILGK